MFLAPVHSGPRVRGWAWCGVLAVVLAASAMHAPVLGVDRLAAPRLRASAHLRGTTASTRLVTRSSQERVARVSAPPSPPPPWADLAASWSCVPTSALEEQLRPRQNPFAWHWALALICAPKTSPPHIAFMVV